MSLFRKSAGMERFFLAQAEDFARFFEQNHLGVFRYAMVLCAGNQGEAEDVTAEAFTRAWEKRAQFSGTAPAALGWVIAIARNLLIDRRRSEAAHPMDVIEEDAAEGTAGAIENLLVDTEQLQDALDAVRSLPFRQGNILTLRYALGWRVKDIAAHLGMAENTVSVELRRGIARLQKKLVAQEAP